MAEGKKSFLLYCDMIHTVRKMPKDKAGELLLHILEYVNDENPETDDLLLQLVFEPIKQQLKRDLNKWELEINKKSNSGKLGNLKRWNLDLYELVIKMQMSIDEAEIIAHNRKESQSIALRQNESQNIANIAVSENVIVSDSVTVNENNSFSKKKKKLTIDEYVKQNKETLSEIFTEFPTIKKSANLWLEYKFKKKGYKETGWAKVMVERIKSTSIAFIEKRITETIAGETYEDYFYSNHQIEFDKQNKPQGKETTFTPSPPKKQMTNEERRRA